MFAVILALVAGCATRQVPVEYHTYPLPAEPVQYVHETDSNLARAAAYSAAYRQSWVERTGGVPGAVSPVVYVSPGTVRTASGGTVKCPETLAEVDTLEERVACLEADVDYILSNGVTP